MARTKKSTSGKKISHRKKTAESLERALVDDSSAEPYNICVNAKCKLRKAGCRGFEGCPGFKSRG